MRASSLIDDDGITRIGCAAVAVRVITVTYQRVPVDVLSAAVHVSGAGLDEFVGKQEGWKVEGDQAVLPITEFNQAR